MDARFESPESHVFETLPLIADFVRSGAYAEGQSIWLFLESQGVGKSALGSMMDAAAKGRGVFCHRLFGHHLIWDMPISKPEQLLDFMEHLASDLFTRQGLPIMPGEALRDMGLISFLDSPVGNWVFLNGFDALAGVLTIYVGAIILKDAGDRPADEFADPGRLGIGTVQIVAEITTANILLVVGGAAMAIGSIIALNTDEASVCVRRIVDAHSTQALLDSIGMESILSECSLEELVESTSISSILDSVEPKLLRLGRK